MRRLGHRDDHPVSKRGSMSVSATAVTRRRALTLGAGASSAAAAGMLLRPSSAAAAGGALQINVAEYGTLGTADDSMTFQKALNAVPEGGAQVVAPYGTYNVSGLTIGVSGTCLFFYGVTLKNVSGKTTAPLTVGAGASNVSVLGATIDGSVGGSGSAGIVVSGQYNLLSDCYAHNTASHGIVVQGAKSPGTAHITVCNCRVYNSKGAGITLTSSESSEAPSYVLIEANHVVNAQGAALGIIGVGNFVEFDNNMTANELPAGEGGSGIEATSHLNTDIACRDNFHYNSAKRGIYVGGTRISITGNTIDTSGNTGILVESDSASATTTDLVVASNMVSHSGTSQNPYSGIYIIQMSGGVVEANLIESPTAHGMSINTCNTMVIAGNTIQAKTATGNAISVSGSRRLSIVGNVLYGAPSGIGLYIHEGSGPAVSAVSVTGNVIVGNGTGGVLAESTSTSAVAVSGNVLTENGGKEVTLVGSNNTTAGNYTDTSATIPSAGIITIPRDVGVATVTGTTTISGIEDTTAEIGRTAVLIIHEGLTLKSGTNLVLASTFVAPAKSTLTLASDGTTWFEVARSAN